MSNPAHRPPTYDDLLLLPEHVVGEIVDGELHVSPRPAIRQANASSGVGSRLHYGFHGGGGGGDRPGGWWILDEPELHLGPDVLVPDIAGWRRERLPRLPDTAALEIAPDWVCEVLSPRTARLDRLHKMPAYARYGVQSVWLVDPIDKLVEVYRLQDGLWLQVAVAAEGPHRLEPFDAIPIDPAAWWVDDEPEASGGTPGRGT